MTGQPMSPPAAPGPSGLTRPFVALIGKLRRWDSRGRLTAAGLGLVALIGIGGAVWGGVIADPDLKVRQFDAGSVAQFAVARVTPFPEVNVYVVGLEDGRLRALDGIVKDSGCPVRWLPADDRGRSSNPAGAPGAFEDPCSDAVWNLLGNAVSGVESPLRTFRIDYDTDEQGVQHVWIEVIGDRDGQP